MDLDDKLPAWADVDKHKWETLLLGNGASIAIWKEFAYGNLFERANLSEDDRALFDALGTTDFEQVLRALQISGMICEQAGHAPDVDERYDNVRGALANAVHQTHVPWGSIPHDNLIRIAKTLRRFKHVFSTNYDLIPYWAIMAYNTAIGTGFKDFIWNNANRFDPADVQLLGDATLMYYLHGGLHLCEDLQKVAIKRVARSQNLLDTFAEDSQTIPLFVSEGTAEQKMRVIRSSDYLWHCYETLRRQTGPLVIFGSSLGAQDAHIARAIDEGSIINPSVSDDAAIEDMIAEGPKRIIAVSIFPTTPEAIIETKLHFMKVLPSVEEIIFFDSRTHPLGDASLRVT
jgi:pterin-4a-carbinolamine dehydratase